MVYIFIYHQGFTKIIYNSNRFQTKMEGLNHSNEQLFLDACRLCLCNQGTNMKTMNNKIIEILENFIKRKIGSGSTKICLRCYDRIIEMSMFHSACLDSHGFWMKYMGNKSVMPDATSVKESFEKLNNMRNFKLEHFVNIDVKAEQPINADINDAAWEQVIKYESVDLDEGDSITDPIAIEDDMSCNFSGTESNTKNTEDTKLNSNLQAMERRLKEQKPNQDKLNTQNKSSTTAGKQGRYHKRLMEKNSEKVIPIRRKNLELTISNIERLSSCEQKEDEQTCAEPNIKENEGILINLNAQEQSHEMEERMKRQKFMQAKYKCNMCVVIFQSEKQAKNHMIAHGKSRGPFVCNVCTLRFSNVNQLARHSESHSLRMQCLLCSSLVRHKTKFRDHIDKHLGDQFACDYCGMSFSKKHTLIYHMKARHTQQNGLKCKMCDQTFEFYHKLLRHTKTHIAPNRKYPCHKCGKLWPSERKRDNHLKTHDRAEKKVLESKEPHYCVECDRHFKTSWSLQKHFKQTFKHKTPEEMKFLCEKCPKRHYATHEELMSHKEVFHGRKKIFCCEHCGYKVGTERSLINHLKSLHNQYINPNKYKCLECPQMFASKAVRTLHMKEHMGRQVFQCDICKKKLSFRSSLIKHLRRVHPPMKKKKDKSINCRLDVPPNCR